MTTEGRKDDLGKLRLDLIPPEIIEVLGEIFTFGAAKYGERNCEMGFNYSRLIGAGMRHTLAASRGIDIDDESGLPHFAMAAWNFLMLEVQRRRGTGQDDRVKA